MRGPREMFLAMTTFCWFRRKLADQLFGFALDAETGRLWTWRNC